MAQFAPHDVLLPSGGTYPRDAYQVLPDDWSPCEGDELAVAPLGGGAVSCLPPAEVSRRGLTKVDPGKVTTTYYRVRMSIEDSPEWWAWTTGERWNGFGTPHFERDDAEALLRWMTAEGWGADWRWDGDRLCTRDLHGEEDCWSSQVIDTPVGDRRVWPVGAWSWTWWVNQDDEERALEQQHALEQQVWGIPRRDNSVGELRRRLLR